MRVTVKNWTKFQHYHNKAGVPPWIKLYTGLLRDYEFMRLTGEKKAVLIMLWLLAAENGGVIEKARAEVCWRLGLRELDLTGLEHFVTVQDMEKPNPERGVRTQERPDTRQTLEGVYTGSMPEERRGEDNTRKEECGPGKQGSKITVRDYSQIHDPRTDPVDVASSLTGDWTPRGRAYWSASIGIIGEESFRSALDSMFGEQRAGEVAHNWASVFTSRIKKLRVKAAAPDRGRATGANSGAITPQGQGATGAPPKGGDALFAPPAPFQGQPDGPPPPWQGTSGDFRADPPLGEMLK